MNKKFLSLLLALLMSLSLILSSCSDKGSETTPKTDGDTQATADKDQANNGTTGDKTLRLAMSSDIPDLDPALVSDNQSSFVVNQIFQTLVQVDNEGKLVGEAAESFEANEDFSVWTFKLRDGLTFSNGDAITAETVKFSWLRAVSPELNSGQAERYFNIKGAKEYYSGTGKAEEVGLVAKDDKTFEVTLVSGDPTFGDQASYATFSIVDPEVVTDKKWVTNPETYIGSGPYVLDSYNLGSDLQFSKNEKYYDAANVDVAQIKVELIQDENTVYRKFTNGELDHIGSPVHSIAQDLIDEAEKSPSYRQLDQLGVYWFKINTEDEYLKNVHLRKALAYAIDRQSIIDNITKGGQKPAFGYVPQFDTQSFKDNDVDAAKQELATALSELGLADASALTMTLKYNTNDNHQKIAQALQEQWKQKLGINIELHNEEWQVYLEALKNYDYQIGRLGWGADITDPADFLKMYMEKEGDNNNTHWSSEVFQAKMNEASQSFGDEAKRESLLKEAEAAMLEDMPVIPLYFNTAPSMTNFDTVEKLDINILGQFFVKYVKMK